MVARAARAPMPHRGVHWSSEALYQQGAGVSMDQWIRGLLGAMARQARHVVQVVQRHCWVR